MKIRTCSWVIVGLALFASYSFGQPTPPVFLRQPQSMSVTQGANVTFSVAVVNDFQNTNQWFFNNAPIVGAVGTSLFITNVQLSNQGTYTFIARNASGSATSSPVVLTFGPSFSPPVITNQPASQIVSSGATVTFTVGESGTTPLLNQWMFNGLAITGATAPFLSIANVQLSNAGSYMVIATNSFGSATSSIAILTVTNSCPLMLTNDPGGLIPGFASASLPPSKNNPSTNIPVCFQFCLCGTNYTNVWIYNDGTVTLDGPLGNPFQPNSEPSPPLSQVGRVILAPFWADIDTTTDTGSGAVSWGCNCVITETGSQVMAFGVTWTNVGYFPRIGQRSDKANSFQLLLIDRPDFGQGGLQLEYRYTSIQWDTAASCHGSNGLCVLLPNGQPEGIPARVGFASGANCNFEFSDSGICSRAMLDNGPRALINTNLDSGTNGVYVWRFTNCTPSLHQ